MKETLCVRCGGVCTGRVGYRREPGKANDGPYCYSCCAVGERIQMQETGKATLYLTRKMIMTGKGLRPGAFEITDWPGRLRFDVQFIKEGRHNIAGTRIDVWFLGPKGIMWHGTQYGKNTDLVHCKRTSKTAEDYGFKGTRNPYTGSFSMESTLY